VVAIERVPLLPRDEAEALAEFEEEVLDAVDDRLLEVALEPGVTLGQVEELEHEGVFDNVAWNEHLVPLPGESENPRLVAALRQSLEEERRDLPLEFASGPELASGLDLVEGSRVGIVDANEDLVVRPTESGREQRLSPGRQEAQRRRAFLRERLAQRC
jgi:hypothetical protein